MSEPKQPLDHVFRQEPPWRDPMVRKTECGRDAIDVAGIITRQELIARVKRDGQQRAAYTTCMTCWTAARRANSWERNPAAIIARDSSWGDQTGKPVTVELHALAALVAAHPEEYAALVAAPDELAAARKAKRNVPGRSA